MNKAKNAALVAIGGVVSTVSYAVLLIATAFIMPISKAYHSGRLSAERAYLSTSLDLIQQLNAASAASEAGHEIPAEERPLGSYL